jgi:hypothetical protein
MPDAEHGCHHIIMLDLIDQLPVEGNSDAMLSLARGSIGVMAISNQLSIAVVRVLSPAPFRNVGSD